MTLRDADGLVVATTTTGPRGEFHFGVAEGLRTGVYTVEQTLPAGSTATSPTVRTVTITGGDQSAVADFGSIKVHGNSPRPGAPAGPGTGFDLPPDGGAPRPGQPPAAPRRTR